MLSLPESLTKYSRMLLMSNYVHIGYKKQYLNQSFRKAIFCFHNNISIIDLSITLLQMRQCANFLLSLMLSNQKVCFSVNDIPLFYKNYMEFRNQYYLINNWPSGIISNFITTRESSKITKKYNFCPTIPRAVLIFGFSPEKTLAISNEAKSFFIPCFSFVDTVMDPTLLPYWVAFNSKSAFAKLLLLNFISSIVRKQFFLRKRLFLNRLYILLSCKPKRLTVKRVAQGEDIKFYYKEITRFLKKKRERLNATNKRKFFISNKKSSLKPTHLTYKTKKKRN